MERKVKIIPEGFKGDGAYQKEDYGYRMRRKRTKRFFYNKNKRDTFNRTS